MTDRSSVGFIGSTFLIRATVYKPGWQIWGREQTVRIWLQ